MGRIRRSSKRASRADQPPVRADVRQAHLAWARSSLPLLAIPLLAIAVQQGLIASDAGAAPPAPQLRGMLIALAAGSVIFGRSFKARPLQFDSGLSFGQAVRTARSASFTLVGFALAPVVMGVLVVLISRSVVDQYLMLAFTLLGFVLLFPRVELWDTWVRHLIGELVRRADDEPAAGAPGSRAADAGEDAD